MALLFHADRDRYISISEKPRHFSLRSIRHFSTYEQIEQISSPCFLIVSYPGKNFSEKLRSLLEVHRVLVAAVEGRDLVEKYKVSNAEKS